MDESCKDKLMYDAPDLWIITIIHLFTSSIFLTMLFIIVCLNFINLCLNRHYTKNKSFPSQIQKEQIELEVQIELEEQKTQNIV